MTHTEEEAKTKWCPFARLTDGAVRGGTYNRTGPAADLNCIASACMAWRWIEPAKDQNRWQPVVLPKYGYCGLAGTP